MPALNTTSLLEGYSPPFATVTPTDHAAWILIATWLSLATFLFFGCIRVGLRLTLSPGFDLDDYTCYAGTLAASIQSALVLGACAKGLGKSTEFISPGKLDSLQQLYYASNFFLLLAIGLSKISVIALLQRISRREHRNVLFGAMALIGVWVVGSILAAALQCDLSHPWTLLGEKCPGIDTRWLVINGLDIATEVAIFGLVVQLVYPLQMRLQLKLTVVYIFSFRLLSIVFIAFRMSTFTSAQPFLATSPFIRLAEHITLAQGQQSYVLVGATVPAFRNFLKSLHTGFGGMSAMERTYGYGSQNQSRVEANKSSQRQQQKISGTSLKMSRLKRSATNGSERGGREHGHAHKNKNSTGADAGIAGFHSSTATAKSWSHGPQSTHRAGSSEGAIGGTNGIETTSIESNESQSMMIRKDVVWSVRTEPRHG
ncbi:hypothetical protein DV735_g1451, partial [Chaetothyriales sp. CBS 134920]